MTQSRMLIEKKIEHSVRHEGATPNIIGQIKLCELVVFSKTISQAF